MRILVIDIETVGEPWDGYISALGWQWWDDEHATVVANPLDDTVWVGPGMTLADALASPDVAIAEWSKYDVRWFRMLGWEVNGPVYDGMTMAHTLNENTPLNLEWCAKRYIHETMDKRIRTSAGNPVFRCDDGREVPLADAPMDQLLDYNRRDVETTTRLLRKLWERLDDSMWLDWWLENVVPLTRVLVEMEVAGLPVDLEASEELREQLEVEAVELKAKLLADANLPDSFNPGSGPQLSLFLFRKVFELTDSIELGEWEMGALKECLEGDHEDCENEWTSDPRDPVITRHVVDLLPDGFSIDKLGRTRVHGRWTLKGLGLPQGQLTPSGDRPSSSSPALLTNFKAAATPWVQDLLHWRKVTKVLTTYLRKFPVVAHEGRIHGRFNQTGTVTGRLSSSEPNLQNLPAHGALGPRVRDLFRGQLVVGDYSQLEPRLMAHFSQDPVLLDVYTSGRDIYLVTAEGIWGEAVQKDDPRRGIAKTYVLAMGYGAGVKKLQQILTINGYPLPLGEVEWQYGKLQDLYTRFFQWREDVIRQAKRDGYVETLSGRHRRLAAQFKSATWKARGYGERQAVNAVIQGSAGDVVGAVMVVAGQRAAHELRLLAQVHDELVWEWDGVGYGPSAGQLDELKYLAEHEHGYDLTVPLSFEPHVGRSWYEAKEGSALILPEDFVGAFEDELEEVAE